MSKKQKAFILLTVLTLLVFVITGIYIVSNNSSFSEDIKQDKSTRDQTVNIIPENHRINSSTISFSYNPSELPLTDKIKPISENNLTVDNTTYDYWIECNYKDAAGHPLKEGEMEYVKFSRDSGGFGLIKDIEIPDNLDIYIKSNDCGYADAIYNIKIERNGKIIREFTDLFGRRSTINQSPDHKKIVFTGVKDEKSSNYHRESFIYDFSLDKVTILPNNNCINNAYKWIDNDTFASINILEVGASDVPTRICIWDTEGKFITGFEMNMVFYIAYPGGMLFQGDIDKLKDGRFLFYYESKIEGKEGSYCTIFLEDNDKFRIQPIYKNPFPTEGICGESKETLFDNGQITQTLEIHPINSSKLE
ncbi:MAG: hypothetical protein ABI721_03090 [Candidatus Dojkabacteria bacterium]